MAALRVHIATVSLRAHYHNGASLHLLRYVVIAARGWLATLCEKTERGGTCIN